MPRFHRIIAPGQWRGISGTILGAIALAGCAHTEPRVVYREIKVPVGVPCKVVEPAVPAYAADDVSLEAPLFDLVRSLLVEREQRKAEAVELRAAVKSCT